MIEAEAMESRSGSALRRGKVAAVILLAAALASAARVSGLLAQDTRGDVFRTRTDVVQLDVSVLDERGEPVRGLQALDFTIFEDGVPQPIVGFSEVELPSWSAESAPWTRNVAPDVASNRVAAQRVVVIVMDDFNTRWEPDDTKLARQVATAIVDRLGPADLAAIVYTVNRRSGQEFTIDRSLLHAAVERFIPSGLGPQPQSRMAASNPGRGLSMPSRDVQRGRSGACLMDDCVGAALVNAGRILQAWPGMRKTLVLISPGAYGFDVAVLDGVAEGHRLREIVQAMQLANINVYQYDPRGLEVEASLTDFGTLAEVTAGRAFTNTNAPDEFVPQMFRENSSYYLIGFEPKNSTRDGSFRKVEVRVNRPDVEVRARSGYYAGDDRSIDRSGEPASELDRALSGGLATGDLPLTVSAVSFASSESDEGTVAVLARVHPDSELTVARELAVAAVAFDTRWREVGAAGGRFMAPHDQALAQRGADMALRLDLDHGRYELRTAVTSPSTGRTGSVYTSITVPDFSDEDLSLSGVIIERVGAGAAVPEDLVSFVAPSATTERSFGPGDRASAVLRVYQKGRRRPEPVRIEARIVDERGQIVFSDETTIDAESFADRKEAQYRVDVPLDRLVPGEHLLAIEATSGDASARRDLRFSVRPAAAAAVQ